MLLNVALVGLETVHLPPGRVADACGVRDEAFQSASEFCLGARPQNYAHRRGHGSGGAGGNVKLFEN